MGAGEQGNQKSGQDGGDKNEENITVTQRGDYRHQVQLVIKIRPVNPVVHQ
jgi:hypothetical protein